MRRITPTLALSFIVLSAVPACDQQALAPKAERSGLEAVPWGPASSSHAGLTHLDITQVPGAADLLIVQRKSATFIVALARDENRAYSHRIDGLTLEPVGSTPIGDGPVKATQVRGRIVAVNSRSNDMSVLKQGDDGQLVEESRVPTGGITPTDVGVVYADLIVVANRGALTGEGEGVTLFEIDAHGNMVQLGGLHPTGNQPPAPTGGNDPHIVAIGRRGLVAVANSNSNDLSLLQVDRSGGVEFLRRSLPVGGSPKALAFHGDKTLFVATRAPVFGQTQDQIEEYAIGRDGFATFRSTTSARYFLTDLEAKDDKLFAVTWDGPVNPVNQILALGIGDCGSSGTLGVCAEIDLPNTPSFQNVAADWVNDRFLIGVTQFQAGALHLIQGVY